MRVQWEALRQEMARTIATLAAGRQFREAGKVNEVLARFDGPEALVAYLTAKNGGLDVKDKVYNVLVRAVQARAGWTELAVAILWCGFWPGLDAIFRHRQRDFVDRPDDLVSDICFIFSTTIERIDLSGVSRLAATLVRNVDRDVRDGLKRHWADQARRADLPQEDKLAGGDAAVPVDKLIASGRCPDPDHDPDGDDDPETLRSGHRTRHYDPTKFGLSDLGLPPGLDVDQEIAALRDLLLPLVGDAADLVIGAGIYEFGLNELADQFGITHAAARKKFQRTIKRLRDRLGDLS